jgi:NADH:ubiquinone oxidoreductase subunit K/NADH:ubiquinone oxidoreductase subunit 6 (subunit J)
MTDAFIVLFSLLALIFAGLVLTLRQPMRAALALVAHMFSLAGIYACLDVHVVALFQVLIYVGAVMVFMVYTIMLLDDRDASYEQPFARLAKPAIAVAAALGGALLWLLGGPAPDGTAPVVAAAAGPAPFAAAGGRGGGLDRDPGGPMTSLHPFLIALAALLFCMGLMGVMIRRNLLVVVMCLELMLNAVVLSFVAGAAHTQTLAGAAMTFFIYVAATCEIALAMAIVVLLVQRRGTLDLQAQEELKG